MICMREGHVKTTMHAHEAGAIQVPSNWVMAIEIKDWIKVIHANLYITLKCYVSKDNTLLHGHRFWSFGTWEAFFLGVFGFWMHIWSHTYLNIYFSFHAYLNVHLISYKYMYLAYEWNFESHLEDLKSFGNKQKGGILSLTPRVFDETPCNQLLIFWVHFIDIQIFDRNHVHISAIFLKNFASLFIYLTYLWDYSLSWGIASKLLDVRICRSSFGLKRQKREGGFWCLSYRIDPLSIT